MIPFRSIPPAGSLSGSASSVVIGIASAGRREQLRATLRALDRLQPQPSHVVICPATAEDLDADDLALRPYAVTVVPAPARSLTQQRNALLGALQGRAGSPLALPDDTVLLFIDDDFIPAVGYLGRLDELFRLHPDVVAATGRPLLDGASGPGVTLDEAHAALREYESSVTAAEPLTIAPTYGTYGCNMAFRWQAVLTTDARFDPALPLYAWLEDIDFSRQLAAVGRVVDSPQLKGVHLGAKSGRVSGIRFGYSQVANPIYLARKGSMSWRYALKQMGRNLIANSARVFWAEPWVDRRGRLKGNALALSDLVRARMNPGRVLELG